MHRVTNLASTVKPGSQMSKYSQYSRTVIALHRYLKHTHHAPDVMYSIAVK